MLTVMMSPTAASAGRVTTTGTPLAASAALMPPPAASGTDTLAAAGPCVSMWMPVVLMGLLAAGLPAASA